jgi:hypothetical protein
MPQYGLLDATCWVLPHRPCAEVACTLQDLAHALTTGRAGVQRDQQTGL